MRQTCTAALSLTLLVCASADAAESTPAARYSVSPIDSGQGRGWTARPASISEAGLVAGVLTRWQDGTHLPFVWSPTLGTRVLPGVGGNPYREGFAAGLNDAGQVVGVMDGGPFLWTEAAGTRCVESPEAVIHAINNAGTIAGYAGSFTPSGTDITGFRAFPDGRRETLAAEGYPRTMVVGINNNGDAIARAFRDDGEPWTRSIVWNADGTLRDVAVSPTAINDKGWVIGGGLLATPDGRVTELGTLYEPEAPTDARGLNNAGVVVGHVAIQSAEEGRAFAWSQETGIVGLNERLDASGEGWLLKYVEGINESGQIVGWGEYRGEYTGFLLTPVPEPGAVGSLAAFGFLALRRRRAAC